MKYLLPLLICLLLFSIFCLSAQEEGVENANQNATEIAEDVEAGEDEGENQEEIIEEEENAETSYIEMDIRTSSLSELAAWCRELGLSEGGTRDDLSTRLRSYYGLRASRSPTQAGQRIITIEAAKTTEYFTLDVVDEEYARLKGDVIVSLKDGNALHRIKAWEILYNRTRNVMTATGNVEYTKEEGNSIETFKGQSITVNLDDWSSIFMDGTSEKSSVGKSTSYRFAGTVISRNSEEVTVLTRATITNPANEEAYWSLTASKLWLLPGNDWAVLNAVLRVGNIPVLYLPFFFYPADEIVFHPVLGYRTREGTYLQTTTYILGRPKSTGASENSLTRIFGGDDDSAPKVREGVFLRTTKEKTVDPGNTQLSVIFDAYTNLGAYVGTEISLPEKDKRGATKLSMGLGLTRDIYIVGGDYTPFSEHDGASDWNSGRFIALDTPFRFRFNLSGSYKITNGTMSWEVPYYSDPYVDRDFMRRTEALDWLSMLREGASSDEISDTSLSSYEWKLTGTLSPSVTRYNPYISSFSISNFSSSMLFNQRNSRNYSGPSVPPNPGRAFFFPSRFTMFSVTAAMAGTPYKTVNILESRTVDTNEPPPGDALLPDLPISPWENPDEGQDDLLDDFTSLLSGVYSFTPPALNQRFSFTDAGAPLFSVNYSLSPTAATELQFRSSEANWSGPEDINWGDVASIHSSFRSDFSLGFNVDHSAYSGYLRLSGTGSFQSYPFLNEGAEEYATASAVKSARDRASKETYLTSSWDFSTTLKPFYLDPVWGNSNLQYGVRGLLLKTDVNTDGNTPVWDWVPGKLDSTDITSHQVSANLAAVVMGYNQNFTLSTVLPPKDSSISSSATFRAWITETTLKNSVLFPFDSEERKIEPFYLTETLRFNPQSNFQQHIVYDPELSEYTTFTSSLNLYSFTASYSAAYIQPYQYNYNGNVNNNMPNGWILMDEKGFYPSELRFAYNKTHEKKDLWKNRLSFTLSLNTSLAFDLQRYTNSRFTFGLGFKLGIMNFLDLDFSTTSENVVVFKYFQGLSFFDMPVQLYRGQENNLFVDLINSFRFDDDNLRRQSGFKMKTMNLSLIHHLGDWNAKLSMKMTPYLPQGSRDYKFDNEISFLVQWVPIGEIKTQIDYVKEELTVK